MHCYIISYDLCQPNTDYQSLYKALKSFPNWGRLTESTWAIISDKDAVEIRNSLTPYIDANDRIIVILSGKVAAWNNCLANNEWIRNNIVL